MTDLNLNEILKKWADGTGDFKNLTLKYDISRVRFEDGMPNFQNGVQQQANLTTEIVFEDVFKNNTSTAQKHRIRCERQTASFAKFDLHQSIIHDDQTKLTIYELPRRNGRASGFSAPLTLSKLGSHEFVEKLTWMIDDEITVPPKTTVEAEVVVTEHTYEKSYEVETKIRGNVHCDVIDETNDEVYTSLDGDICEILRSYANKHKGLVFINGAVSFKSTGVCKFRHGVSKIVNVK